MRKPCGKHILAFSTPLMKYGHRPIVGFRMRREIAPKRTSTTLPKQLPKPSLFNGPANAILLQNATNHHAEFFPSPEGNQPANIKRAALIESPTSQNADAQRARCNSGTPGPVGEVSPN